MDSQHSATHALSIIVLGLWFVFWDSSGIIFKNERNGDQGNHVAQPLTLISEECVELEITGFTIPDTNLRSKRPLTWYDCKRTFSNGTWYRRLGDLKP